MAGYTFHFKQKMRLNEAALKAQLTLAGYSHVSQVVSPGEYAVRGGLIDLFPMGSPVPYRVDLFGDEVDSIRTFDPDTQRSLYPVPEVRLLPGREFPMDEAARNAFRSRWRERIEGDPSRSRIYKDIGAGLATAGIEYYLPLFFEQTATMFDYLGDDAALVLHGEVDDALQRFWVDTRERHRFLQHDPERPILPPEDLFLRAEDFFTLANTRATLVLRGNGEVDWARPLPDVSVERGATEPLAALERHLDSTPHRVLLLAESEGRRESLLELLRDHRIDVPSVATLAEFEAGDEKVAITVAPLAEGFFWFEPGRRAGHPVHHRDRTLRHHAAGAAAAQAGADEQRRCADQGPVGAEDRRSGGARQPRHRPLPGPEAHRPGRGRRRRQRVPAPRVRRQGDAVRAGRAAAPDQPLHRRQLGRGAAAPAGLGPVGQGQAQGRRAGARHRRRTAEPVCPARRARGHVAPASRATTTKPSPPASASRKPPTSAPRSTR